VAVAPGRPVGRHAFVPDASVRPVLPGRSAPDRPSHAASIRQASLIVAVGAMRDQIPASSSNSINRCGIGAVTDDDWNYGDLVPRRLGRTFRERRASSGDVPAVAVKLGDVAAGRAENRRATQSIRSWAFQVRATVPLPSATARQPESWPRRLSTKNRCRRAACPVHRRSSPSPNGLAPACVHRR
jgi:hypothetical protein